MQNFDLSLMYPKYLKQGMTHHKNPRNISSVNGNKMNIKTTNNNETKKDKEENRKKKKHRKHLLVFRIS